MSFSFLLHPVFPAARSSFLLWNMSNERESAVNTSENKQSKSGTSNMQGEPQEWQDAREAMRSEPAAVLAVSSELPGLLEMAQGRQAERWATLDRTKGEELPLLTVTQGNAHWLRLLLEVYLLYLQKKAPPRVTRQDDIEDLSLFLERLRLGDEQNQKEPLEMICNTSQIFILRDAVLFCRWLLRDWLPTCSVQQALLRPLDELHVELEKLLGRVLE